MSLTIAQEAGAGLSTSGLAGCGLVIEVVFVSILIYIVSNALEFVLCELCL